MQRRGRPKKEVKLESRYLERSRNVKVWFQYPKSPSKVLSQVPDNTPSYWAIESTPDGHRRQKPKPRRSTMENGSLDQLQWKLYSPNTEKITDWKFAAQRRENEWRTTSIMSPRHTHRVRGSLEKPEPGDWKWGYERVDTNTRIWLGARTSGFRLWMYDDLIQLALSLSKHPQTVHHQGRE